MEKWNRSFPEGILNRKLTIKIKRKIMKKYLITGGAGFIGSNFVKYILKKYSNIEVVILDKLTYAGNLGTIKEEIQKSNVTFVKGDICNTELVENVFMNYDIDCVVNFAAESHVDRSIEDPRVFLETNIMGTQNLLDVAKTHWTTGKDTNGYPTFKENKKFLQVSTDEVYGALSRDFNKATTLDLNTEVAHLLENRKTQPITFGENFFLETTPLDPRSPYSVAKTSADMLVKAYQETYHMPINITRCSNNYGPYHFPEKLIPLMIKNVLEGKNLPVYGKGENVRDWLYVEDHCKAIDAVLEKGRLGEVYNIGGFNEEQNIDIVKLIIGSISKIMHEEPMYQKALKTDMSNLNENLITYVTDRLGHDARYAIDPTKIATELGWYPETPFSAGIEKTIRWNLDNQEWIEEVASGNYQKYYDQMYGNR